MVGEACSLRRRLPLPLVSIPKNFCVFAGMGLYRIQDAQILMFIHAQHVQFGDIVLPVVNFQPVNAGPRKHGKRAHADRRRGNRTFVYSMLPCVFVRKLVDLAVWNGDQRALRRLDFDRLMIVTKSQNSFRRPTLRIRHFYPLKRSLPGYSETREGNKNGRPNNSHSEKYIGNETLVREGAADAKLRFQ
jgi:hypothetical protein